MSFILDKEKAKHVLLYVIEKLGNNADLYKTLKIIYFAEKLHILNYGRPITGDRFVKQTHGPVPSYLYDIAKENSIVKRIGNNLTTSESYDIDEFSQSDINCLDKAIEENRNKDFSTLKADSHGFAYNNARNRFLNIIDIAKEAGLNEYELELFNDNLRVNNYFQELTSNHGSTICAH